MQCSLDEDQSLQFRCKEKHNLSVVLPCKLWQMCKLHLFSISNTPPSIFMSTFDLYPHPVITATFVLSFNAIFARGAAMFSSRLMRQWVDEQSGGSLHTWEPTLVASVYVAAFVSSDDWFYPSSQIQPAIYHKTICGVMKLQDRNSYRYQSIAFATTPPSSNIFAAQPACVRERLNVFCFLLTLLSTCWDCEWHRSRI